MRLLFLLASAAWIVEIIGVSLSTRIYRWEMILEDCALFAWMLAAWVLYEVLRKRRADANAG